MSLPNLSTPARRLYVLRLLDQRRRNSFKPDDQADQPMALTTLIEGCKRGERLCQEKLYALFFDQMLAVIRRSFSDQDAAISILNNGFLRAFKKLINIKAVEVLKDGCAGSSHMLLQTITGIMKQN